ncbi:MAG: hypothetical protein Q7L55_01150 [Actinomycetota bacterium]|nr:hypothetical protein [Actinomycetota bacterium]
MGVAPSSRDPRLVAVHRGGSLAEANHRLLAAWAADCAERVLPLFEVASSGDTRPADALSTARAWAAGQRSMSQARAAAVAAHAAARATIGPASLAARACGHAAATAHMADHDLGAAYYALLAIEADGASSAQMDAERRWQLDVLPEPVAELVRSDMRLRSAKFQDKFQMT